MDNYEKLGVFYLGRELKSKTPLLFESKDFTTHAVIVGMTGSGKTGLGIGILEEAALDKIPALIIDPKGDVGNLLLTFPELKPEDFEKWGVEDGKKEAKTWSEGLKEWNEGKDRIKRLKDSVEYTIYTPGSRMGRPISILDSFDAPSKDEMEDEEAFQNRISTTAASLLNLIGVDADPIKSREHILISAILSDYWKKELDIDLATLIAAIQKPPFVKIGVLDIETFYPAKERLQLSMSLNNLLAAPGFQAWLDGDPLDVQKLLYSEDGTPRHSIFSIAHLSDRERMFFVTLLLNATLRWMRKQSGTSVLRALLFMDEIYGFFPPTAEPPSKKPMITLLKQARAIGLGIILTTQNPVDLDYKGLSNCGTWFIGKLQTDRDRARIIEGLKLTKGQDADQIDKWLSSVGKRIFLLYSVHLSHPVLFETRWTLSYLLGPLTLPQIKMLTPKVETTTPAPKSFSPTPKVLSGIDQYFIPTQSIQKDPHYKPYLLARVKLHFVDSLKKIDTWEERVLAAPLDSDGKRVLWDEAENITDEAGRLTTEGAKEAHYGDVNLSSKDLKEDILTGIFQTQVYPIFQAAGLKIASKPNETESEFHARLDQALREKRDSLISQIKSKYEPKIATLRDRVKRAQAKVDEQTAQVGRQKFDTYLSVGATILGALLGRKATTTTINQAGSTMRRAGRIGKEETEATLAKESQENLEKDLESLQQQFEAEISSLESAPLEKDLETIEIRPRKSDIAVLTQGVLWKATDD